MEKHLNILVSAYSCSPNWGSEPGMAWNWITNLSNHFKIHLITNTEFKDDLLNGLESGGLNERIQVYFNDIGEQATIMGKNQGDWRFYYYYRKWQKTTYKMAKNIINSNDILLVHQLNMIGFREPGFLWKLDKPSVWGPVGGMNFMPSNFISQAPFLTQVKLNLKNFINFLQINFSLHVSRAIKNFDIIVGAVNNSKESIKKYKGIDIPVLNETGANYGIIQEHGKRDFYNGDFNILWVGKSMFRKQFTLALDIILKVSNLDGIKFHVVGIEKNEKVYAFYKEFIEANNLENVIVWHGKIPQQKVSEMMRNFQLFLFTSIEEGTPHVIMEAIENKLPCICFDTCGQGECVNDNIGIKIEMVDPKSSIKDFSKAINRLYKKRDVLEKMSLNCIERSKELSWESKTQRMLEFYKEAINKYEKS